MSCRDGLKMKGTLAVVGWAVQISFLDEATAQSMILRVDGGGGGRKESSGEGEGR